jgi:fructose-specific phosphotransferase system IIC component
MIALWAPLLLLAVYPKTVAYGTAYALTWCFAFIGGSVAGTAVARDRFIPGLVTGIWAGTLAVTFSPARDNLGGSISTICVYAFFCALGSLLIPEQGIQNKQVDTITKEGL